MAFAAPIWLLGLIPWGLLATWLMLGRHAPARVPFLPLWEGPRHHPRPHAAMRFHLPPTAVVLALTALLLALLAAAGLHAAHPAGQRLAVIVDRSLTMSAGADHPRFATAADRAADAIPPTATVELVDPIDHTRQILTGSNWLDSVRALKRTAINADSAVTDAARDELARSNGTILVLTDHPLPITDARLSTISPPAGGLSDVGIAAVAARARPTAQVMVTLRSHRQAAGPVTLTVTSGPASNSRRIDLPATGDANVFIDLPSLGDTVEAKLSSTADDLPANDAAWLVRTGQSPRIEVRSAAVPEPVRRFADVYARARPATEGAPPIALAADQTDLSGDHGAVIPSATAPATTADPHVASDPLTLVVDWKRATTGAPLAPDDPRGEGWTPLVSAGDRPLVARRDSPARQVWVGFDQSTWSRSPDFVVFWANALHWLAGDAPRWTSDPVRLLGPDWTPLTPTPKGVEPKAWPGLYRDDQGRTLAMNAAPAHVDPPRGDEPTRLRLAAADAPTWSRPLLIAAVLCVFLAALTWRGS